ncbi:MAG: signal peptidase I [Acidimicrobiales bacterium]
MRRLGRGLVHLAWYVIPGLAVLLAGTYIALALSWHVDPPFVPVEGQSMRPFLVTGDLVLLHGVNPTTLHKGQVIAVTVPQADQQKYDLPGEVVHRIISITHSLESGLVFQTKGDANAGPDVFQTPAANVIGVMTGKIAGAGYPVLFFRSRQGDIFLAAAGLIVLVYLLLGWAAQRRAQDPAVVLLETVLAETSELRAELAGATAARPPPTAGIDSPAIGPAPPNLRLEPPSPMQDAFETLAVATAASVDMGTKTNESIREVLKTMREYAAHLRSHTLAVEGMSQPSMNPPRATADISRFDANTTEDMPVASPRPVPPAAAPRTPSTDVSRATAAYVAPVVAVPVGPEPAPAPVVDAGAKPTPTAPEAPPHSGVPGVAPRASAPVWELLSVEVDLARAARLVPQVTRYLPGPPWTHSPYFTCITWAAAVAWRRVWPSDRASDVSGVSASLTIGVWMPGARPGPRRLVVDDTEAISPNIVYELLNTPPSAADLDLGTPALHLEDWSQTGMLLVLPGASPAAQHVTLSVGGVRQRPVVTGGGVGPEEHNGPDPTEAIAVHPVVVLTLSAPVDSDIADLLDFLGELRRLLE